MPGKFYNKGDELKPMYQNKETGELYIMDIPFAWVTRDWNNDNDVYAMEVCYLKKLDGTESWRHCNTRDELEEFYTRVQ